MRSKEETADHAVVPDHLWRKMMSILRFHARQERDQNERGGSSWRGSLWISALKLKADEMFMVVEGLIKSLDEPDKSLDAIWAEEAKKRLKAYRAGNLEGIPMEEIFKEE